MDIDSRKIIRIDCTPDDLRAIADNLDRAWDKTRLGDDVPREIVQAKRAEIHFVIDQDNIGRSPGAPRKDGKS